MSWSSEESKIEVVNVGKEAKVSSPTDWKKPKIGKKQKEIKPPPVDSRWNVPIIYGYQEVLEKTVLKGSIWKKKVFLLNHEGKLYHFKKEDFKDVIGRKPYSVIGKKFSENVREGKICVDISLGRRKVLSLHFLEDGEKHQEFFDSLLSFSSMKDYNFNSYLSMIVLQKLKTHSPISNAHCYKSLSWEKIAKSLSNVNEIKKTYLNYNLKNDAFDKYLKVDEQKENEILQKNNVEYEDNSDLLISYRDYTFFETAYDFEMLKNTPIEKFKFPLRIAVTEVLRNSNEISVKNIFHPVLEKIPKFRKSNEFGQFSLAIIIGPYYLEYTENSLVIPKRLNGFLFSFYEENIDAFPYYTYLKRMTLSDLFDKIAKVVVKWNSSKKFHKNCEQKKNPFFGNSAMFVEEMLNAFDIRVDDTMNSLVPLFQEINRHGSSPMLFKPSKAFKNNFKIKNDSITFKTHYELDEFLSNCQSIDEIGFNMDYKREFSVLKCFDRLFWLRYIQNGGKEKKYSPYEICPKVKKGCYFKLRIKFLEDKEHKNFPDRIPPLVKHDFSKKKKSEKSNKKSNVKKAILLKLSKNEVIIRRIVSFIHRKEFPKYFSINSFFLQTLNESESFWKDASDGRKLFGPVSTKAWCMTYREFFLSHYVAPNLLVLYSSKFVKEEEVEESFKKTFPINNKECITFVNIHMRKLPCFNFFLPYDIIYIFGGSHFLFEHDSKMVGNRLFDFLKRKNKSVITLMFCNWYTNDEINSKRILAGCWKTKDMFLVCGEKNGNEGMNEKNHLKFTKNFQFLSNFEKSNLGSNMIASGVLNERHGRLIASWTNGKSPYVAIAESTKYKILHFNMFLTKETVDVVMALTKYIHTRQKDLTVKKEEEKKKCVKKDEKKNVGLKKEDDIPRSISKDFEDVDDVDEISDISDDDD